jgi:hypothetical protein
MYQTTIHGRKQGDCRNNIKVVEDSREKETVVDRNGNSESLKKRPESMDGRLQLQSHVNCLMKIQCPSTASIPREAMDQVRRKLFDHSIDLVKKSLIVDPYRNQPKSEEPQGERLPEQHSFAPSP